MGMLGERTYPLITRGDGAWVDGRWVDGTEVESTVRASIQPAKKVDYDQLQALLEGRRVEAAVRIYTRVELKVAGTDATNGDVVIYQGRRYLLTAASNWQMGMGGGVDHYRYLAVAEALTTETVA
jgi:hypothetical protein